MAQLQEGEHLQPVRIIVGNAEKTGIGKQRQHLACLPMASPVRGFEAGRLEQEVKKWHRLFNAIKFMQIAGDYLHGRWKLSSALPLIFKNK
jgi:hypothetical protein